MEPYEIDNRYPEYAEPYEPVKGRKKRKAVKLNSPLLAVAGAVLLLAILFQNPVSVPMMPAIPPQASVTPKPQPQPEPQPVKEPEPVPEPDEIEEIPDTPPFIPIIPPYTPDPPPDTPDPPPETPDPPPDTPDPPVPDYTAPSFASAGLSHDYTAGTEDLFHYSFVLNLEDADTDQPMTVRLQYGNTNGTGWTDVPAGGSTVSSLSYDSSSESTGTWQGELLYDVLPMELDPGSGVVRRIRIAYDYILKDGSKGKTLYSDDVNDNLWAYKGDYVHGDSAVLSGNDLSAKFKVDTDLVMDTGKVTAEGLTLKYGDKTYSIPLADASVSPVADDGTITVSCTLDGIEVAPGGDNSLTLALTYTDKNGAINKWQSSAASNLKVAPTIEVSPYVNGPAPEGYPYPVMSFDLMLNDLKGGSATGKVYADLGDGFVEIPMPYDDDEYLIYDPEKVTGDVYSSQAACLIYPPEGGGIAGKAKIVFDIVYPDGTTGTVESDTRPVHNGTFATVNESYEGPGWKTGERTDPDTGTTEYTITFDLIIDPDLVDADNVETNGDEMWVYVNGSWENKITLDHADIERSTGADGKYHMYFTYANDIPFPDGEYWFIPEPWYQEDKFNKWIPDDIYYRFIKSGDTNLYEPEFTAVSQEHEQSGTADNFIYNYTVEVNDADLTKPVTLSVYSRDPYNYVWDVEPIYTETYSGTGGTWSGQYVYDIAAEDMGDADGIRRDVEITVDYTMPNGMTGRVYSDEITDLVAYKGDYLTGVSAELSKGKVIAKFKVDTKLIWYTYDEALMVDELVLYNAGKTTDISKTAEISDVDYWEGDLTVTYTPKDGELDLTGENTVKLTYRYVEENNGLIDWKSSAETSFDAALTDPEVTLGHVWYWGEFNAPMGLQRVEVAYTVTPNDAEDIVSDVYVTSSYDEDRYISQKDISGSGAMAANMDTNGVLFLNSVDYEWIPSVELHYTLGCESKTKTFTFAAQSPRQFIPVMDSETADGITTLNVGRETDDRYEYDITIEKAELYWATYDGDYYIVMDDPIVLWQSGSTTNPAELSGPSAETEADGKIYRTYTLNNQSIDIDSLKPAEANCMMIQISGSGQATDPNDGKIYTLTGGVTSYGEFIDLP